MLHIYTYSSVLDQKFDSAITRIYPLTHKDMLFDMDEEVDLRRRAKEFLLDPIESRSAPLSILYLDMLPNVCGSCLLSFLVLFFPPPIHL